MNSSTHPELPGLIEELDIILDTEFTFINTTDLAGHLLGSDALQRRYLLDWAKRVASTNTELAHQFLRYATHAVDSMDRHIVEDWALHAMDEYDQKGLHPALKIIHKVDDFVQLQRDKAVAALLEEHAAILQHFANGLTGRQLEIRESDCCFTDSETVYLPAMLVDMPSPQQNFLLYKSMLVFAWAQTRFGTFQIPLMEIAAQSGQVDLFTQLFFSFETLRLEGCIARALPGLYRDMCKLKKYLAQDNMPENWRAYQVRFFTDEVGVRDSVEMAGRCLETLAAFEPFAYQGELRPDLVDQCKSKRIAKEKAELRTALYKLQQEHQAERVVDDGARRFDVKQPAEHTIEEGLDFELTLDDQPVAPPENIKATLRSIILDLGEIPDEYLVAAGPGEYDPDAFKHDERNPDDVWQGTYHEEGAFLYDEWDFQRQHYRKNWCAVREKQITPKYDDFAARTLHKYHGLIKHLRKIFEAMREEDRLLKRQVNGDGIDFDALVEALADTADGSEMSDRLYTRMRRVERNIAVIFMVDMSGSTKGWINDAEREALLLMAETLETLDDNYAMYGFSGMARKRCEIYKIKRFDEVYDAEIKARISGIEPQDYTRMGFAIRHLTSILAATEARTRLLITLSDGKPDDYDNYRGVYGIQDTRRALIEARRRGIHPYCITIDSEAKQYLSHMYGDAEYTVIDSVAKLPYKVSDIYRRLTT